MEDDVFSDLPDKGGGDQLEQEAKKPDASSEENAAGEEQKGGLSKAVKAEEKKVAELERLRELRDKKKKLAKELQDGGEAEPNKPDISIAVGEELKKRDAAEYEARMVAEIKAMAKSSSLTKADAEEILRTANAIPKSGNAALDVKFATDRVLSLRNESARRGGVPGSFSATSPFDAMDSGGDSGGDSSGISEAQKAMNREVGVSDEDYKKYSGDFTPHAKRLFTDKNTGVSRFLDRSDLPANAR